MTKARLPLEPFVVEIISSALTVVTGFLLVLWVWSLSVPCVRP